MFRNPLYKLVLKNLALFIIAIALVRFTMGFWLIVMTLAGVMWALSRKTGKALAIYIMIICMVEINPILLPMGSLFGYAVRFGPLLIGLALMVRGLSSGGQSQVPLGMLVPYLLVAIISSIGGWAPIVSYLKILNFAVFMLGFWFGLRALREDLVGIDYLRATFFAYSIFLIIGSALLLPFPAISTLSGFQAALREVNLGAVNAAMLNAEGMEALFCGVTRQSQAFAIHSAMVIAWLLADMLFLEKRISRFHVVLIAIAVPLLYLSRSRTGLLSLIVGIVMVAVWLPNKIDLIPSIKRHLKTGVWVLLITGLFGGAISEISSNSITMWLRKTDDVEGDNRSLSEAVTSTRQGLMEESMRDFKLNPMLGRGFQVAEETADLVARKGTSMIISAPIEKGVLPVMVLGEGGVVGASIFAMFLFSFYSTSSRRKLFVTAALFTVFLATNMGEATFFSPGGGGGQLWAISIIGGYCIDMKLMQEHRRIQGSF